MSWHMLALRLLRLLPSGDRAQLEPELATVLEDTEFHHGVGFRDTASIGSLVVHRWAAAALRNTGAIISALLAVTATLALAYIALTAHQLHEWVTTSLPCDASVLTETDTIIDPAGYHLYSDSEVQASQAWDTCMADSRALLAADGIVGRANLLYWPLLLLINAVAGAAFLVALSFRSRSGKRSPHLKLPVALGIAAFAFQGIYANTISVVTTLVE